MREKLVQPKPAEEFEFKDILYTKKDGVATVTWNRPKVFNSYSTLALLELKEALRDAANDDGIGVLVLTGAGDQAFCTGGDVQEYQTYYTKTPRDFLKWGKLWYEAFQALTHLGKPTIARINGMAVGGGNEWHIACDLSVAADHAKFRQVGTRVGSVAASACMHLPILVGDRRAREILLLCEEFDAKTALEWGWVNKVVPAAELDDAVAEMCKKILNKFPECTRATLNTINFWKDLPTISSYHMLDWLTVHFNSCEAHEGMNSFIEGRAPDYAGLRAKAAAGGSTEFMWGPNDKACSKCNTRYLPDMAQYCLNCGEKLE